MVYFELQPSLKGSHAKCFSPSLWCYWAVVEALRRNGLMKDCCGKWPWRTHWNPVPTLCYYSISFLAAMKWAAPLPYTHVMIHCLIMVKVSWLANHGEKPLNLWITINLSSPMRKTTFLAMSLSIYIRLSLLKLVLDSLSSCLNFLSLQAFTVTLNNLNCFKVHIPSLILIHHR